MGPFGAAHAPIGPWLVFCFALAPGCGQGLAASSIPEEQYEAYPVAVPEVRDVSLEREYVGEIRAIRYAEVRSRVQGILEEVGIDDGQDVGEGALLFSVSAREHHQELLTVQAAVASAEAEVRAASIERDNSRLLFERKVVSEAQLSLAEATLGVLEARLEEAKARAARAAVEVEFAQIRAPFDGRVNRILRREGSAIAEHELLTTISDASEVHVYFRFSEREMLAYLKADPELRPREVTLQLPDGSVFPHAGVVDAAENEVDQETGNLALRATFPNPEGLLKHGGRGKIVFREVLYEAMLVPQVATFDVQGNLYVYAMDDNDVVHARKLVERCRVGDSFVVESGIGSAERFLLEGVHKVREGQSILVRSEEL